MQCFDEKQEQRASSIPRFRIKLQTTEKRSQCSVSSFNAIFCRGNGTWQTGHTAAGMRHSDTHLRPFLDAGQRRLQCVGGHACVDAARAQVMHLPAEDFFDAEADDVTVDQFVEWNAEPLAFLILLQPGGG